jgi:hypothetical protein
MGLSEALDTVFSHGFQRWHQTLLCTLAVAAPATGGEHSPEKPSPWYGLLCVISDDSPPFGICFTLCSMTLTSLLPWLTSRTVQPHHRSGFSRTGVLASSESIQTGLESQTRGCRRITDRVLPIQGCAGRDHSAPPGELNRWVSGQRLAALGLTWGSATPGPCFDWPCSPHRQHPHCSK